MYVGDNVKGNYDQVWERKTAAITEGAYGMIIQTIAGKAVAECLGFEISIALNFI